MPCLEVDVSRSRIPASELRRLQPRLRRAWRALESDPAAGFLELPSRVTPLRQLRAAARDLAGFRDGVQLGIGGSSLGAQAIYRALSSSASSPGVRLHFADNVDPQSFGALLDSLSPRRTLVHVVSKSGGTLETLAQLRALLRNFSARDPHFRIRRRAIVTTGASGPLREFARREGLRTLDFPEDVGGRFSALTPSGLLLPVLVGIPVQRILRGARDMRARCADAPGAGPAGALAALGWLHDQRHHRPIHVQWIYSDALLPMGEWFRQLWAESLGKGGRGPTPIVARGTTDQHSQLQLHAQGPDDKLYTVLRVARRTRRVPLGPDPGLMDVGVRDLGEIFDAEAGGTVEALVGAGRPVVQLWLERVSPEGLGELLMLQQLQTALAGALYEVDPFDQPGVELGKRAALKILRKGAGRGASGSPGA
ncbi:MAG: glucose-6-phosphate isomerase [Myxococcota bacterium]